MTRDEFVQHLESVREKMLGYTEQELEQIARVYDIRPGGQLTDFLMIMGRSDGGLIGDYDMPLYRTRWSPADHQDFQQAFYEAMKSLGFSDFLQKPFVVAWLSENQYFFVQTASERPGIIYHFDEVEETVDKTEWDLFGFIVSLANDRKDEKTLVTAGQLLEQD